MLCLCLVPTLAIVSGFSVLGRGTDTTVKMHSSHHMWIHSHMHKVYELQAHVYNANANMCGRAAFCSNQTSCEGHSQDGLNLTCQRAASGPSRRGWGRSQQG